MSDIHFKVEMHPLLTPVSCVLSNFIPCYVGVPDVIIMDMEFNIIAIGEVSHNKHNNGFYQLLGSMFRVYQEEGFLPCGIYNAIIFRNFISQKFTYISFTCFS